MPYCSNCGAQNTDTAKFCINCGAALNSSSPPQQLGAGSRVSFVAGDGKTYTGTIKEINGDQYKVKYDAFNFESWLARNQFTLLSGGSTPPVYTPVSKPAITSAGTSASTVRSGGSPIFITHLGFWGSVMIIIGFFTDWLNFYGGGISGYTILSSAKGILNDTNNDKTLVFMLIGIAVIVLSAVICMFYTITGIGRAAFTIFKILPFLTIIGCIAYVIVKMQENTGDLDVPADSSFWKVLGIGIYLTLIGSFVLAISRFRK
jgi:hypothetical protein